MPPFFQEQSRVTQDVKWLGTVHGRVDYANGNWLLFATGGLAYAQVDTSYSLSFIGRPITPKGSESNVETGWTVGGGAEFALGQWSLKGEYLYYNFSEQDFATKVISFGAPSGEVLEPDFETQGHIARVGLNYHFN